MGKEEIVNFLCLVVGTEKANLRNLVGLYNQKFPGVEAASLLLLKKLEEKENNTQENKEEICNLFYIIIINYIRYTLQMTN